MKIKKRALKVGQKVVLVDRVPDGEIVGGYVVEMRRLLGKVATIRKEHEDHFKIL